MLKIVIVTHCKFDLRPILILSSHPSDLSFHRCTVYIYNQHYKMESVVSNLMDEEIELVPSSPDR